MKVSTKIVVAALLSVTLAKVLLMPAYRSTDFDVHRNWLAITRNLPVSEWYFDDVNGTTVHTLDYPPSFAYFEYALSSNSVTDWLLRKGFVDERCFALLPDKSNSPSDACVVFHRSTVILSDVVLWMGSFLAATAVHPSDTQRARWSFLMIVLNPGLLWLDHVHFQYNGMLLGLLLLSLGLLVKGAGLNPQTQSFHLHHLAAAIFFALLLTMKHLYMTLAPLYFVYLLSSYCLSEVGFDIKRFSGLAFFTGSSLVLPFLPFVSQSDPSGQMRQMLSRLFPFGRGLCHDYWAANVWALWMLGGKIMSTVGRRAGMDVVLPDLPPPVVACFLLAGIIPGLWYGWKAKPTTLLHCVVFCAVSSFMLGYHVHEKAIMTAILPMTLLATSSVENARLYLRMNVIGLLGLFPLLFRNVELLLKVVSYVGFLALAEFGLRECCPGKELVTSIDRVGLVALFIAAFFMEFIHPLFLFPRMEFLPLLIISTTCALGLVACWVQSFFLMRDATVSSKEVQSSTIGMTIT